MNMQGFRFPALTVTICFSLLYSSVEADKIGIGSTLYCYRCVSSQPGCGGDFNWMWFWSQACPEKDDTCVKLIEKKGVEEIITRDCLSSFRGLRTDIPSDHYEGCRKGALDVKLGNFVNNTIKELDIKRDHFEETTWCFCHFDNRCNSSVVSRPSCFSVVLLLIAYFLYGASTV